VKSGIARRCRWHRQPLFAGFLCKLLIPNGRRTGSRPYLTTPRGHLAHTQTQSDTTQTPLAPTQSRAETVQTRGQMAPGLPAVGQSPARTLPVFGGDSRHSTRIRPDRDFQSPGLRGHDPEPSCNAPCLDSRAATR
jgi:hypothetical protein